MYIFTNFRLFFSLSVLLICQPRDHQFFVNAIYYGDTAQAGDVPWQLYIRVGNEFICGATLVTLEKMTAILTTAACVIPGTAPSKTTYKPSEITVTATHQFTDFENHDLGQHRGIKKLVVHEDYNPETLANNLAILFLERDFEYKREVFGIGLPDYIKPVEGTVSGFGARGNSAQLGNHLKMKDIKVRTTTEDWCFKPSEAEVFKEKMFCILGANSGGVATCKPDRGSPFRYYYNNIGSRLGGIISHQRNLSCDTEEPSLVVKVSSYLDWIKSKQDAYLAGK